MFIKAVIIIFGDYSEIEQFLRIDIITIAIININALN
jgi:hypothetical protein